MNRILSLMALTAGLSPLSAVQAHLNALNTELVISHPDAATVWTPQEQAEARSNIFTRWTFLCRAMVPLEEEWPLAAENGRETALRLLDRLEKTVPGK